MTAERVVDGHRGFAKCESKRLRDEKCVAIREFMFYLTSLENL